MNSLLFIYHSAINQPLWNILLKSNVSQEKSYIIVKTAKNYFDDRTFKSGDSITIRIYNDSTIAVSIKKGFDRLYLEVKDSVDKVIFKRGFIQKKLETISGSIEDNLYSAILDLNELPELVEKFVDIFAWDIDFSVETESGDSFAIVVEKLYYSGKLIGYGNIYYALYYSKKLGKKKAIWFEGKYFDENGKAINKLFLKSPLKIYKITSAMGYRFHPILRVYRMHHGVDYAAPYGTPVFSMGPGVVTFAGWKGGYGKLVTIKHPNGYETRYAHLSKIAVRVGQRVSAGEYIGNVGSTGLSTGPHLHLEMRKDGYLVNPLKIKNPPSEPVSEEKKEVFLRNRNLLESICCLISK